MPSPFPGMDPWLEAPDLFPSLHERLAVYISEELNARMPAGYVATIKNRVWVEEEQNREPDVGVLGSGGDGDGGVATLSGLVLIGDARRSDPVEELYLEVVSSQGKRLITAIEIISLTNKLAGKRNRKTYQRKQREYHRAGANLVEIDLLRDGPHVTCVSLPKLKRHLGPFDYHVAVRQEHPFSRLFAAGFKLGERLPSIAIPLDQRADPVQVDLQPLLDRAYDTGRYSELVDYAEWCEPPLSPAQRKWAEAILREKGLLPDKSAPGS